jgi:hypothetical protein
MASQLTGNSFVGQITIDNDINIVGNLDVDGTINIGGDITFANVRITGDLVVDGSVLEQNTQNNFLQTTTTNGVFLNSTTSNAVFTNGRITNATISNIVNSNILNTNLTCTTARITEGFISNVNNTNLTGVNAMITNITASNINSTNGNLTNITNTNLLTTRLTATGTSHTLGSIFTTDGNVGLNTITPTARLHIFDTTNAVVGLALQGASENSSRQPMLRFGNNNIAGATQGYSFIATDLVGSGAFGQGGSMNLFTKISNTTAYAGLTINQGSVGINTTSPNHLLHVIGGINSTSMTTGSLTSVGSCLFSGNKILINSSGGNLNPANFNGAVVVLDAQNTITTASTGSYLNPVNNKQTENVLNYNTSTKELSYKPYAYGQFISTTSQSINATTGNLVVISSAVNNSVLTLVSNKITFNQVGKFKIGASLQFSQNGGSGTTATFYFKKNGTNVANSGTRIYIPGNNTEASGYAEIVEDITSATDYIEVYVYSKSTGITIQQLGAVGDAPATPGVIVSVYQLN